MDFPLPERCDYCQRVIGEKEFTKRVPGSGAHVCYSCFAKLLKEQPTREKPLVQQANIPAEYWSVEQEGPHVQK